MKREEMFLELLKIGIDRGVSHFEAIRFAYEALYTFENGPENIYSVEGLKRK